MPGHARIKGIERTDSLGIRATMVDGRAVDSCDILNTIRDTGQNEFSCKELDSRSLT